eukprot:m.76572 g.76572  ORF g.76572 m.76572 type:complete len:213 (+) comp8116_c3_seq1:177-815(+)
MDPDFDLASFVDDFPFEMTSKLEPAAPLAPSHLDFGDLASLPGASPPGAPAMDCSPFATAPMALPTAAAPATPAAASAFSLFDLDFAAVPMSSEDMRDLGAYTTPAEALSDFSLRLGSPPAAPHAPPAAMKRRAARSTSAAPEPTVMAAGLHKPPPKRIRPTVQAMRERREQKIRDLDDRNRYLKTAITEARVELDKVKVLMAEILRAQGQL